MDESEKSAPTSLLQRLKDGCSANGYQISVSFWSTLAFVGLGSALGIYGPTLLDLASRLSVGVGPVSAMLAFRGLGAIGGSLTSGVVLDRMEHLSFSLLYVIVFVAMITTGLLPLSVHLAMLAVIIFFQGAVLGAIDNGINSTLMKMWKQRAGPSLQCIFFGFAIGGLISPLYAEPFLSEDGANVTSNYTSDNSSLSFAWAYAISASLFIVPLVAFLYYAIRLELWKSQFRKRRSSIRAPAPEELETNVTPKKSFALYKLTVHSLLFLFLFFFEGLVIAYGTLIFTVAVTGELEFSKDQAAHLTFVFWAAFTFARIVPITLALLKVPAIIIMVISLTVSLISTALMMIFPHDPIVIWIGTAALGTGMSPASPTAMMLLNEYIKISGKGVAVVVTGAHLGVSALPASVGQLVDHVSPDSFFSFTFGCTAVSALLMAILFVTNFVHKRKRSEDEKQAAVRETKLNVNVGDASPQLTCTNPQILSADRDAVI